MLACAVRAGWQAGVASHYRALSVFVVSVQTANWSHLLGHAQTVELDQHAGQLTIARGGKELFALAGDAEANLRVGQRVLFEQVQTMADLSVAALEKF